MKLRGSSLLLGLILAGLAVAANPPKYKVAKTNVLGGEGGWDYLTVDSAARRVYITRGTHVMVIDADSLLQVGDIPDTPGVHGVALVPDLRRGFTSNGRANTVTVFDVNTLKPVSQVKVGDGPDAIAFDAVSRRVFTFNARGHDTTAIDAGSGEVAASLPLGGKPEFAVPDGKGFMFVNIEDKSEMVRFDTRKLTVVDRWPITGCEEPTGLALDARNQRLFIGCGNRKMAIMAADSGKLLQLLPIGPGVDGVAFDPVQQLAFSTNGGNGTLSVVQEQSPQKFALVQDLESARGARTVALDSKTHNLYTITAQFEAAPASGGRPPLKPGTFQVMLISPQ